MNLCRNKISSYIKYFIYSIVWLFIFIATIYFHPTSEQMFCNSEYDCKITHEYFHILKFNEDIKLNKDSTFSYIIDYRRNLKKLHLIYDNKRPFVYYFDSDYDIEYVIQNEINNFNSYKTHPQSNYIVKSAADSFLFYLWFIGSLVLFLIFIYTYKEE